MPDDLDIGDLNREIHGLSGRLAALRATHASYPEDAASTLEAILAELGLAEQLLQQTLGELEAHPDGRAGRSEEAERRTLRTAFTELPVPVLLLDREGGVRRANQAAAELLGVSLASVTGKPFSLFVDLRRRAAVRSQLSAALRGERPISFETRLARRGWAEDVHLTISNHRVPSEPTPMLMVVVAPPLSPRAGEPPPLERQVEDQIVVGSARRLDIMARMTRLLLDERSRREPVALRRAARLLAGEYAEWVLVDLHGEPGPRRAVVAGPEGGEADRLARLLESLDPAAAELPAEVLDTGQSVLLQLVEEEDALGRTAEGVPTLNLLRAGSVVGVPLRDEIGVLGALTLVRPGNQGSFQLADLGLLEELGEHLGLALRTERSLHRRVSAAENLQASLQPSALPGIPGLDIAAVLRSADGAMAAGGDFYDVFPSADGWGLAVGDVSGRGEEAAAAAATVRHGIRLLGLWAERPEEVLGKVNEALLRQSGTHRFVTALAARVDLTGRRVAVRLAGAGHPRPLVLKADGTVAFGAGGGLPLGLFEDPEPAPDRIDLDPGDLLLLYSDGITEASSAKGDPYGEERLADVMVRTLGLSAAAAVKAVEDDVEAHTGGRRRDDMAILAVRVGNPPES